METKQLKIPTNGSAVVEFMFDQPKTGTNNYGQWNLYGLRKDGEDVSLFATDLESPSKLNSFFKIFNS